MKILMSRSPSKLIDLDGQGALTDASFHCYGAALNRGQISNNRRPVLGKKGFRVLDSDLHVSEPGDLYDRYLEEPFRSRAPILTHSDVTGVGKWLIEGEMLPIWADWEEFSQANEKLKGKKQSTPSQANAFVHGFDAKTTLQAMDIEGIDIAVLYRTVAGLMGMAMEHFEPEFSIALCRAYNNWLYDYCQTDSDRLKGVALIPFRSVDLAIKETQRAIKDLGFLGVTLHPEPVDGRLLYDKEMEPLWDEFERLGTTVGLHGTSTAPSREDISRKYLKHPAGRTLTHTVSFPTQMMTSMAGLILSGLLERHPGVKVAFLEANCSWLPWFLYRLDDQWTKYGDSPLKHPPSYYFHRQCYISTEVDDILVQDVVSRLGDDSIVLSSDYPHPDSSFPHAIDEFLALDLSDDTKRKILWDNCARFYGIED
jgi:predicted TIM-barrel fold metal-dependent hydrolase